MVALGLLLVVLLALSAQRPTADLDPEGTGPEGARALAEVLRQQGVEVEVVRSIDALEDAPNRMPTPPSSSATPPTSARGGRPARRRGRRSAGRLVLLGVDSDQLSDIGLPVEAFGGGGLELVAGCDSEVVHSGDGSRRGTAATC